MVKSLTQLLDAATPMIKSLVADISVGNHRISSAALDIEMSKAKPSRGILKTPQTTSGNPENGAANEPSSYAVCAQRLLFD